MASQLAGELGRLGLLLLGDVLTAGDVAPTLPGGVDLTGLLLPPHVAAAFPPLGRVLARRLAHAVERELAVLANELVVVLIVRIAVMVCESCLVGSACMRVVVVVVSS